MYHYRNPVIAGFNPDPSICRDGDDFYLVTSSFEFFPGVPIYHSRNLVNWALIGHCLSRNEQVPLTGCRSSGGIYAPTLRKHDGVFYMTTTNITGGGNFIVHAENIRGPWSNPAHVDQGGIDPSLLFDEGHTWFCSTGQEGARQGVFLCEVDPMTGKKLTASRCISFGCGGKFPEAPHIYHLNGWYYLMLAEGGTEYGHMVTIQRSRDIFGHYEPCPHNPVLSHRNRGGHPIQALGHADITDDKNGAWWMVCLGIRPLGWAMLHNLGRETFLAPLRWDEGGWPVVGDDGTIEFEMEAELPEPPLVSDTSFHADFTASTLDPHWTFIRNPDQSRYHLENGRLRLMGDEKTLSTPGVSPAFVGLRQQSFTIEAITTLSALTAGKAGISACYNSNYHYDLGVERATDGSIAIFVNRRVHDLEVETFRAPLSMIPSPANELLLRIITDHQYYSFSYRARGGEWHNAGSALVAGLCTEGTLTMSFTGVFIGLFCSDGIADFASFTMRNE
jgi:alpha-N-arabinofuranosidase